MDSRINREARDSRSIVASLPARHPLAQGIALALALGMGGAQAGVFNVTTNADSGTGSLRQAVLDANASPGADQITFDLGLGTIALTSGQIDVTETLTITGPGAGQTIDAGGNSRILAVTVADQSLTLENLTLTGGRTLVSHPTFPFTPSTCADDSGHGGGVCAVGDVVLISSTVSGNSTAGDRAGGGGLYIRDGDATLTDSTITGNSTVGEGAEGGGLHLENGDATLTNSTVSGNSTAGDSASGGGFYLGGGINLPDGNATLTNSTVSGNSTAGDFASGGGLVVPGNTTLTNSTVSGNSTAGDFASGGGLYLVDDTTLINSTVSGNSTAGDFANGGGVWVDANTTLTNSTVSGNSTAGFAADGGGLFVYGRDAVLTNSTVTANQTAYLGLGGGIAIDDGFGEREYTVTLASSLLAANSGLDGNLSLLESDVGTLVLNASNSVFGDDPAEINGINSANVFTDSPGVAPLADNGCAAPAGAPISTACVQTHPLLPGSPALDAGSNPLSLTTDQRGAGFPRVVGVAADIGAFELGACSTLHLTDHIVSTNEFHDACQIRAGPNMVVTPEGDLTLKGKVRVVLDTEVGIEKGGRLRIQIEP